MSPAPGLVAIVIYDGLATFELGIAVEVFAQRRPELAVPWYACRVVSAEGRRVRALGGIEVTADAGLAVLAKAGTIVLPGWRDAAERPPERLLTALVRAHARGARLVSICSGAFILAAAGLLDGRRATTHWRYAEALAAAAPLTRVDADVLYVDEGSIITAAGSAAGIDACLHLVRRDYGASIANAVARRLVVPPHREGGQAQFVVAPVRVRPAGDVARVLDWARGRLDRPLTIGELAGAAAMSERTFLRRFREAVGEAPRGWLERERMARARELLEASGLPLVEVATACGYGSPETFRAVFRRVVGMPPKAYRERFRGTAPVVQQGAVATRSHR